jgi:uncharacterized Zn-binding protein involved in type VI secretion
MPRAARITDSHNCKKHPPGMVRSGSGDVNTGHQPAARVGDVITCGATIESGASNVFINGREAARLGDPTSHDGRVASGCPSVNIGTSAQSGTLKTAAKAGTPFAEECQKRPEPPSEAPEEISGQP